MCDKNYYTVCYSWQHNQNSTIRKVSYNVDLKCERCLDNVWCLANVKQLLSANDSRVFIQICLAYQYLLQSRTLWDVYDCRQLIKCQQQICCDLGFSRSCQKQTVLYCILRNTQLASGVLQTMLFLKSNVNLKVLSHLLCIHVRMLSISMCWFSYLYLINTNWKAIISF